MNAMSTADYQRELKLTLENTESLYREALGIVDRHWESEQIKDLYIKVWSTINSNAGENVAPTLLTDHDVKRILETISITVCDLQHEAKL